MGKNPSVIQINGNRFDASSGHVIGKRKGPVIDGLVRRPHITPVIKNTVHKVTTSKAKLLSKSQPTRPAHDVHSRTQRSKTLMRSVVTKPAHSKPQATKTAPKARVSSATPARLSKAMHVAKNSSVRHFSSRDSGSLNGEVIHSKASSAAVAIQPMPNMITSVSSQRLEQMLDEALFRADAHKKALTGKLSPNRRLWQRIMRLPTWAIVILSVLVLSGAATFLAWRNIPAVSMEIASIRSSIKGSLPNYVPAGYKFAGPIKYNNGTLSMTYKAADESKAFTITQQSSKWDSKSLKANAVPSGSQVQTSQVNGNTVYMYGEANDAAWVNNGVLYTVKDKANLSSEQIINLVKSLQ